MMYRVLWYPDFFSFGLNYISHLLNFYYMNLLMMTTRSLFVQLLCNITFKNLTLSLFPSLKVVLERFILTQKIYEILRAAFVSNYY